MKTTRDIQTTRIKKDNDPLFDWRGYGRALSASPPVAADTTPPTNLPAGTNAAGIGTRHVSSDTGSWMRGTYSAAS